VFWQVDPTTMTLHPPQTLDTDSYDRWRDQTFALRRFRMHNIRSSPQEAQAVLDSVPRPPDEDTLAVTAWLIEQMESLAEANGVTLLWITEVNLPYVYGTSDTPDTEWRQEARDLLQEADAAHLDLLPVFEADYAENGQHFEFRTDAHWNEHAHQVVAGAVSEWIAETACGE
jgi:hypothetical protein